MAALVPILEYLHELKAAGVPATYPEVLADPLRYWKLLPKARQVAFLPSVADGKRATADVGISVVKRRKRPPLQENLFLRIEARNGGLAARMLGARDDLFFERVKATDVAVETTFEAASAFVPGSSVERRGYVEILDAAWAGDRYDVAKDGAFVDVTASPEAKEIERYWVDEPFALVRVMRDREERTTYRVVEPALSEMERRLFFAVNRRLGDILVLETPDGVDRATHLSGRVFDLVKTYRARSDRRTAYKLGYFFLRNYVGLARLEPVMRDTAVEDVSCNGPNLPVYLVHARHRNMATDLVFEEMELDSFTIKLAQRGGKLLSVAQPLVDATLTDGSRIQASLGHEVTSHGSAFTIRKFREDPLTCVDLIRTKTHTPESMAYLWLAVELNRSLVVMGATASGKTTTLNCLSQFIPPTSKVVTIEDTREITLQHENWLAAVTRDSFTRDAAERITMYDLLRAALRQRPEYIIVGEIRGQEGLTLFQAMSTGHTCFSTMHAGSVENAVYRLENPPIGVPRVMLSSLDCLVLQGQTDIDGKQVRRMLSLTEVTGVDPASRNLRTSEVFRWDATSDTVMPGATSVVLDLARDRRGWSRSQLEEELAARRRVLEGLVEREERHFTEVARAVHAFYRSRAEEPKRVAPAAAAVSPVSVVPRDLAGRGAK